MIFSASIPRSNAVAALTALQLMREEPERIERVTQIGVKMRKAYTELGFHIGHSVSPIIPILIGDNEKTS